MRCHLPWRLPGLGSLENSNKFYLITWINIWIVAQLDLHRRIFWTWAVRQVQNNFIMQSSSTAQSSLVYIIVKWYNCLSVVVVFFFRKITQSIILDKDWAFWDICNNAVTQRRNYPRSISLAATKVKDKHINQMLIFTSLAEYQLATKSELLLPVSGDDSQCLEFLPLSSLRISSLLKQF